MPSKKICRCGKLIDIDEIMCPQCKERKETKVKEYNKQRGSSYERGYDSKWQRYRIRFLKQNPLCSECLKEGIYTPSKTVDHIVPHKGDMKLFWDRNNHQALCKRHHDINTAKEDGGFGNGA
ncbi:HNH endonuclease [Clostridium homopropionicum DSM 5847]|uniref:Putative HNH nuclease YajD n=1 Tax=Clostridium homopropionicum DSM 5847 TaxID=1121318 RepID=A0A0L6Z8P4_9CLOT|nr:HNH endonuclease signature motif containing protein [Clostridium homopropionicum]KOA19340.1 HNH endonuclease [Clostridium homopropionicum DSM 5847]SFG21732.1 5-methylcytosine-specific restriction enzyme A [Clostridium homopropionicum]